MRVLISILFILQTVVYSGEAAFVPVFSKINTELASAKQKREEIAANFEKLKALTAKNMLIESQISSILQELSTANDFNIEAEDSNAKGILTDIARSKAINDGYENINSELNRVWK